MCCLQQDHKNNQFVVKHLTDESEPERVFNFEKTKFVTFLGLGRCQVEHRISFLGKDSDSGKLSITIMSHDKTY